MDITRDPPQLFSADSHVIEDPALWEGLLPPSFWPGSSAGFHRRAGGLDPARRVEEMRRDGVFGEVLYPTLGLRVFGMDDAVLQAAACRRYNEWLVDHCAVAPEHLFGVGMIPAYDPATGVEELEFCRRNGLRGVMVWQTPHPDLPFWSSHHDPIWAAAEDAGLPVSLHILTGHNHTRSYGSDEPAAAATREFAVGLKRATQLKQLVAVDSLFDLVFSGVFDRFPSLRIVVVENEVGWLPFVVEQWDYYLDRFEAEGLYDERTPRPPLTRRPSDHVRENVRATFFRDPVAAWFLEWWGRDVCMWSNDFPHGNSTWPESCEVVARTFGHLADATLERVLSANALELYGIRRAGT